MSDPAYLRCDSCGRVFATGASPLAARARAGAAGCLIEPGRDLCFDCSAHERARTEQLEVRPVVCPVCGRPAGAAIGCPVSERCRMAPLQRRSRSRTAVNACIYRRAA